jgi:16S rRNA processing protein RimM
MRPRRSRKRKTNRPFKMPDPGGKKAGTISKPNGLQGKVNMILEKDPGEQIKNGFPLFISIDGQRVPFFVEEVETVGPEQAIIKLEFIDNVEDARKITGCEVFLDHTKQPGTRNVDHDFNHLLGFSAFDLNEGHIGLIRDYLPHAFNPVFLVDREGREILVPATEELIDHIDLKKRSIYFHLPEGLTDL